MKAGQGGPSWIARHSRSLSFKQARVAVVVGVVLGIGFSALQIAADLRNERRVVDATFEQALMAFEESAFQAAFGLDKVLAGNVVGGLFQQKAIFEATIVDNFGSQMAILSVAQRQGPLKWLADGIFGEARSYTVPLWAKDNGLHAGDLSIRVDTYVIAENFMQRSGLILAFGLLRNLFLAVILATLFHFMLTRPLRHVAALIKSDRNVVQIPPNHENDERGDLVRTHNELSARRSEAEERFRDFANAASDWFWEMGRDLRFTYHSERFFEITGFRPEDNIGATHTKFVDPKDLAADDGKWRAHFAAMAAREAFSNFEYAFKVRDGSILHARISGMPVFATDGDFVGYRGTGTDITTSKQAVEALAESEERYRTLTEGSLQGIGIIQDNVIAFANNAFAELLGYRSDEMVGRPGNDFIMPEYRKLVTRRRDARLQGEESPEHYDLPLQDQMGHEIWVDHLEQMIIWNGRPAVHISIVDISQRKQAEAAMLASKEDAEYATLAKSEFLANMSHELRTPLNAIIGYSEIMKIGSPEAEALKNNFAEYSTNIFESGHHLLGIINDLLDLSRIEAGKVELAEENIDIATEFDFCLKSVKGHRGANGSEIHLELAQDLPMLSADRRMMRQIVINLMSNAIKYAPGQIILKAKLADNGGIEIGVKDVGQGMSELEIEQAMQPFVRTSSAYTLSDEGTGLGLPLVKAYLELHVGHIQVESTLGAGTYVAGMFPSDRTVIKS